MPCSSRRISTKTRKKSVSGVNVKQIRQQQWRKSLGRGGRAVNSAIDQCRKQLRRRGVRRLQTPQPRLTQLRWPVPGDSVYYVDRGKKARGVVYSSVECNDPQPLTQGWIVVERPRGVREKDRRLCRFVACPLESTGTKEGHAERRKK